MADVASNLYSWSTTASSNSPSDATTIGAGLADNFQQIQATVRQDLASKGADIASASTTDIGAVPGKQHDITGTTTITSLGTVAAGIEKRLQFDGALILTNSANLILPGGANITTAAGDVADFTSEGAGVWRCAQYTKASGKSVADVTLVAEQAATSGTSIDFTGIPAGTKRITVMFKGVSTDGSSPVIIQIGDAGGIEASGYTCTVGKITGGSSASAAFTTGFGAVQGLGSPSGLDGAIVLSLEKASSFSWVASGSVSDSNTTSLNTTAGAKSTSAELDRVRITTVNGTDTFDAGAISISYE